MVLLQIFLQLVAVVTLMLVLTAPLMIGREPLLGLARNYRPRIRAALPYLGVLVATLLINARARRVGPDVSWIIGIEITGIIYGIEGTFVPTLQAITPPVLVTYFSFSYLYGYVYLMVFPLVAYLALEDPVPLRKTVVAYTFNYVIGLTCYILFIAYGPRNMLPTLVEPLMYVNWPRSQILTSQVNVNTNVFPSLHSSLSATVFIMAYRTREVYPKWLAIAAVLSTSVVISTMVLGIHWGIDVAAGLGLAWLAVRLADRIERRFHEEFDEMEAEAAT